MASRKTKIDLGGGGGSSSGGGGGYGESNSDKPKKSRFDPNDQPTNSE